MSYNPMGRDWRGIKEEYATGDSTLDELSRKHGIPVRSMRQHSRKEHWVLARERFRTDAAHERHEKIMNAALAATLPSLLEVDLSYVGHVKESQARLERVVTRLDVKGLLGLPELRIAEQIHSDMYLNLRTACGAEFQTAPVQTSVYENLTEEELEEMLTASRINAGTSLRWPRNRTRPFSLNARAVSSS